MENEVNDVLAGFEGTPTTEPEIEETQETTPEEQEVTQEQQETTEVTEGEQQETPEEPFLNITYNKEAVALDREKAIELSQKGMNYDKLMEKYNSLANSRGLSYLESIAQKNNMTIDELIDYQEQQELESQIQELVNKNIPEEYAREFVESKNFRNQYQEQQKQQQQQQQQEQEMAKQQQEFMELYPDVAPKDIPDEVWKDWENGTNLAFAYMKYERKQMSQQLKEMKTNENNVKKTFITGGIKKQGAAEVEDDYLKGFFG